MAKKKKRRKKSGEVAKTQAVRVADVLIIGPLMGLGGMALMKKQPLLGSGLILFGIGTTIYNARNYTSTNEALQRRVS